MDTNANELLERVRFALVPEYLVDRLKAVSRGKRISVLHLPYGAVEGCHPPCQCFPQIGKGINLPLSGLADTISHGDEIVPIDRRRTGSHGARWTLRVII